MTLSIGAIFPPDELNGLSYKNMPFPYPPGVALCTDSRLTLVPGGQRDIGNKVFQIVPGIALVYAGNVAVADLAIKRLSKVISRDHMASPIHTIRRTFRNVFRKAHAIIQSKQPRVQPSHLSTHYLVGCFSQSKNEPFLTQFNSPEYEPIPKRTISAIGSTEAVRRKYLEHVDAAIRRAHSWPGSVMDMAALLSSCLGEIIESQIDRTIGGIPEVVTIDSQGTHPLSHIVMDEDLNKLHEVHQEGPGWVKKGPDGVPISRTGYPPYGT